MNKKIKSLILLGFVGVISLSLIALLLSERFVQAANIDDAIVGPGYFQGEAYNGNGKPVLPKDYNVENYGSVAIPSSEVYDIPSFKQFLWNRNYAGAPDQLKTAVAYIVCTMLEQPSGYYCGINGYIDTPYGTGRNERVITQYGWNKLNEKLANPNLQIDWNTDYSSTDMGAYYINTMYGPNQVDVHQYPWQYKSYALIDFTVKGTLIYRLARDCANPLGGLPGLPTPDPPPSNNITPYSSFDRPFAEPGEKVWFRHGGYYVSGAFSGRFRIDRYTINLNPPHTYRTPITGNLVVTYYPSENISDDRFTIDESFRTARPDLWTNEIEQWREYEIPTDAEIGSLYCEKLILHDLTDGVTNREAQQACVTVVARPYVKFFGADVNFCGGAGNVYTSARGTAGGNYYGSSVQYALFAYAKVNITGDTNPKHGFYSRSQSSVSSPKYLTFANTATNTNSSSEFGGGFGTSSTNCVDYYNNETAGNPTPITAGNPTIGATTINGQETRYVNGDAYINGNITYDSHSWATPEAIPSYRLIVSGNIYIKGDVTKLDGFYFAKGKIYTCVASQPAAATSPSFPGYNDCNHTLKVFGAMQANGGIKYWRTAGTLSQAPATESYNSANIAESIILSPEMYLSNWNIPTNPTTTTFSSSVDSIKNLPPIF